MQEAHRWQFFRAGGVDQVVFRSGADIARIGELDQKLWVELACPTRDAATMAGRIPQTEKEIPRWPSSGSPVTCT